MYAVEGGHTTVVKELCIAGADVSIKDRVSYNILHVLYFCGLGECLQQL